MLVSEYLDKCAKVFLRWQGKEPCKTHGKCRGSIRHLTCRKCLEDKIGLKDILCERVRDEG